MRITGASVFDEKTNEFIEKDIFIDGECFSEKIESVETVNAKGYYAFPGFVDVHVHGGGGGDFSDANKASLERFLKFEAKRGVTSLCPTSMTLPKERLFKIMDNAKAYIEDFSENKSAHADEADFIGINLEGPFISPEKKGAQSENAIINPDFRLARELNKRSGGSIRLIDFAPERLCANEFIKELKNDFVLSLAHTACNYEIADKAFKSGVHHITHLYNAMNPFLHRAPGILGAAADNENVFCELICDGFHVKDSVIRASFKLLGENRICLISDSMRACGMADGEYEFGGHIVGVHGGAALLPDGTVAASITNAYECFRICVLKMGIPIKTALRAGTVNPARAVGEFDKIGSIESGKRANLILADKNTLEIKSVILRGRIIF